MNNSPEDPFEAAIAGAGNAGADDDGAEATADYSQYTNTPEGFCSGFVSFVGRPNTGKSTLTNALVGQKIAITADQPETTRHPIRNLRSEEHTSALQSRGHLVCRLLLAKKNAKNSPPSLT